MPPNQRNQVKLERQFPEVFRRLKRVNRNPTRVVASDFTQQTATTGELSEIAAYRFPRPAALRQDVPYRLGIVAHESFTTDGNADNQEQFDLSYDIVSNPDVTPSFLLYEGTSVVSADAVDYANDHFDYTDDGTENTLHAYYLVGSAARVVIRKVAPGGTYEDLLETNTAVLNVRDQIEDPFSFSLNRSKLQPVLGKDWELKILVDAAFEVQWDDATDAGATAANMVTSFPVHQARQRVPDLDKALRHDIQNE